MNKIGIIGATGNLGRYTVSYLLERGVAPSQIVIVARNPEKAKTFSEKGIEVRYGDYSKDNFDSSILTGIEKLLFISSPLMDGTLRIKFHAGVAYAAKQAGVKHIVYTSLANMDRIESDLKYVHSATEAMILSTEIPYTILRDASYMDLIFTENDVRRAIQTGKFLSITGGNINAAARKNMAEAAAVVLTTPGHENKIYDLTYPQTYTYSELAAKIAQISGKPVQYQKVSHEEMSAYLKNLGLSEMEAQSDSTMFQNLFTSDFGDLATGTLEDLIGSDRLVHIEDIIRNAINSNQ